MTIYEETVPVSTPTAKVLIHDHRSSARQALSAQLSSSQTVVDITCTEDGFALVDHFTAHQPAIVLIGIRRGDPTGMHALDLLLSLHPSAPVIVFGVASDNALLAVAVSHGARGILLWDVDKRGSSTDSVLGPRLAASLRVEDNDARNLTARESQVLRGMSRGRSNNEIGRELYLSEDTIKTHARRLFSKLGARDRAHAVALGLRLGHLD